MESSLATLDAPHRLSDRVLARLIEISFSSETRGSAPFREAFRDFAEYFFTYSLEEGELFRIPARMTQAVDALAIAFSDAVASGALERLRFPCRLTASTALANLAALERPVRDGELAPAEAADLITTTLFDGWRSVPPAL